MGTMSDAMLLIALGMGYFVLYFALKEQKKLRLIGIFVGALIMGLAIGYILVNMYPYSPFRYPMMKVKYHKGMKYRQMPRPKMQPWLPKEVPSSQKP